jgi:hypothetical protein
MKTKELNWKFYYELQEIKHTGFTRLSDHDGFVDKLCNYFNDGVAMVKVIYKAFRRKKG